MIIIFPLSFICDNQHCCSILVDNRGTVLLPGVSAVFFYYIIIIIIVVEGQSVGLSRPQECLRYK